MSDFSLGVSEDRVISQFEDFINATVKPRNTLTIEADGQIHRYTVDGDKSGTKNGAYALYLDGRYENNIPAGYVQNWKTGDKFTWKYNPSDDERKEYGRELHNPEIQAKREKEHKEREREKAEEKKLQEEKQAQARAMALKEYEAGTHFDVLYGDILGIPYLRSKFAGTGINYVDDWQFDRVIEGKNTGFPPMVCRQPIEGGICKLNELLVPMRDVATGRFKTLIRIPDRPDSEGHWPKKYYKGISTTGTAYIIRPQHTSNEAIYVCEGFATAIAVMITLESRYVVLACGSCHNLLPVCKALREKYSKGKIIIVADNDKAGIEAAEECMSEHVADKHIKPETAGFDWCDELVTELRGKD